MSEAVKEVEISRLGAQGDGVVETAAGPAYVPFALPGERYRLAEGQPPERLTASSARQQPVCRHFEQCGGCVAQHMAPELYREWKESTLRGAFASRGIDIAPEPLRTIAPGSRRRAFFGGARRGDDVVLGFREEGRHALVDLAECPVLDPVIVRTLPGLRAIARMALPPDAGGRQPRLPATAPPPRVRNPLCPQGGRCPSSSIWRATFSRLKSTPF